MGSSPSPLTPPPPHLPYYPLVDLFALQHYRVVQFGVVSGDADSRSLFFKELQPLDDYATVHLKNDNFAVQTLQVLKVRGPRGVVDGHDVAIVQDRVNTFAPHPDAGVVLGVVRKPSPALVDDGPGLHIALIHLGRGPAAAASLCKGMAAYFPSASGFGPLDLSKTLVIN